MSRIKVVGSVLRESIRKFATDNCLTLSASISFFAMFSFFPLAMLMVSIFTTAVGSSELAMERISNIVGNMTPVGQSIVTGWIRSVSQSKPLAWGVGIGTLIWGARHVFNNLAYSASVIWGRSGWKDVILRQLVALILVGVVALLLLASIFLPAVVEKLRMEAGYAIGNALVVVVNLLPYFFSFLTFTTVYLLTSPRYVPRKKVILGAVAVVVTWEIAKTAFLKYIGVTQITTIYGSIGGIMILMFWLYISAGIVLWGMEFIAASHHIAHRVPHLKREKAVLVIK
jgi:membrane protein